jgi:hypothetical protein
MTGEKRRTTNGYYARGPRGGKTTVSASGLVKKNLWVPWETAELLRDAAYVLKTTEAEIVRQGIELWRREHWSDDGERAREAAAAQR